jgi:hypothetical protein
MSLSDLASLGSFVSGMAVLASLLFLGLQLRQGVGATAAQAMGIWLGDYNAMLLRLAEDPDLAALMRDGLNDFAGLSTNNQLRFDAFMSQVYLSGLYLFRQRQVGAFDREMADKVLEFNASMYKMTGGRQWWNSTQSVVSDDFRQHMSVLIEKAPHLPDEMPWFGPVKANQ